MRDVMKWTVAASMAVSGAMMVPSLARAADPDKTTPPAANQPTATNPESQPFALPAGAASKDLKQDEAIRKAFGKLTQEAVTKDGFKGVTDRFVAYQRDRLDKEYKENKDDQLNVIVGKIQGQWKDKYHHDFDMDKTERDKAFAGFTFMQGEITTPEQLAGNWPIPQPMLMGGGAARDDRAQVAGSKTDLAQAKLEKGRDIAVVDVPAAMGLPEVRASLLHEHVVGWKFEVPTNLTGQQLHDNLVKHLSMVADHPEQWPADADAGYRMVAHHVLMAIYNVNAPMGEAR